jgi:hypothetical protein
VVWDQADAGAATSAATSVTVSMRMR